MVRGRAVERVKNVAVCFLVKLKDGGVCEAREVFCLGVGLV